MRGTSSTAWATLSNLASSMGYSLIGAIETYVHGAILTRRHSCTSITIPIQFIDPISPVFAWSTVPMLAACSLPHRLLSSPSSPVLRFLSHMPLPVCTAARGKKRKECVLGTNHGGQPTAGKFHYSYKPKHIAHQREVSGMRLARALYCCEIMMLSGSNP